MFVTFKTPYATYECYVSFQQYTNGRTAIQLYDREDDLPVCTATINLPHVKLAKDEVIIRNTEENEGVLQALVNADIVQVTDRAVKTGFIICPVCKLIKKE